MLQRFSQNFAVFLRALRCDLSLSFQQLFGRAAYIRVCFYKLGHLKICFSELVTWAHLKYCFFICKWGMK